MFVRSLILGLSFILFSCGISHRLLNQDNSLKGYVQLCNNSDEKLNFFAKNDSNVFNLKLYSNLGFKVVDLSFFNDSVSINYAYNNDIEVKLKFYIQKYQHDLCMKDLMTDVFLKKFSANSPTCYYFQKVDDAGFSNFYKFFSLKQEQIFSLERVEKNAEKLTYRIFNESLCIAVYFK